MPRARPRRGALGLRGRIVGAVLVTTVATLAVAAVTLLGPLESRLRNAALTTLRHDTRGAQNSFKHLDLTYIADLTRGEGRVYELGRDERSALQKTQNGLGTRIGATVVLLGHPDRNGAHAAPLLPVSTLYYPDPDGVRADPFDDVAKAFRSGTRITSFGTIDGTEYARVAIPLSIEGGRYVMAIRRPIDEVTAAAHVVRTAFIYAALAGLGLTLILGIPLSGTLVRRLRRLRQAALELARGAPEVKVPVDRWRDEVGDLARTFALMQQQLQRQEEARRAFVATASHELRTPLASLDGMLELIEDDLRDGATDLEDARALLERARAQSRRLGRLAADLLDLSRLDAQVQLRSEPVELGELSRAVLAEFELGGAERSITSTLDTAGPVWAMGDPGSVARILRILLDNAQRASPPGAEIRVELHDGDLAELSVTDCGPGVLAAEREVIFERFQRGRDTSGSAGFGLGLAIGRELAERMGGELRLDDQHESGARFVLTLPAAPAPHEGPVPVS